MEKVRAKFKCTSVTAFENGKSAKLNAVYGTSEENKDFTQYTPSGELNINITNEAPAVDFFEPGKEYYLDFTKA